MNAQTHKHLSLSGTEDRGIESIHIWRGNRACGDSRVVGASGGSQWCAAERNSFESRFLRVTQEEQHNTRLSERFLWFKKWPFFGCALRSHLYIWVSNVQALETDSRLKFGRFYGASAFLYCQDFTVLSLELMWSAEWHNITFIWMFSFHTGWSGETFDILTLPVVKFTAQNRFIYLILPSSLLLFVMWHAGRVLFFHVVNISWQSFLLFLLPFIFSSVEQ